MSENSVYYIKRAEQRDLQEVERVTEFADGKCIRFYYEIDNDDVCYRGIRIEDFEKACLVSRIELLDELENKKPEDYKDIIARFVMNLEFRLFDGLYMGDLEDLIEEKKEPIC